MYKFLPGHVFISCGSLPRSGIAGSYDSSVFNVLRTHQVVVGSLFPPDPCGWPLASLSSDIITSSDDPNAKGTRFQITLLSFHHVGFMIHQNIGGLILLMFRGDPQPSTVPGTQ